MTQYYDDKDGGWPQLTTLPPIPEGASVSLAAGLTIRSFPIAIAGEETGACYYQASSDNPKATVDDIKRDLVTAAIDNSVQVRETLAYIRRYDEKFFEKNRLEDFVPDEILFAWSTDLLIARTNEVLDRELAHPAEAFEKKNTGSEFELHAENRKLALALRNSRAEITRLEQAIEAIRRSTPAPLEAMEQSLARAEQSGSKLVVPKSLFALLRKAEMLVVADDA